MTLLAEPFLDPSAWSLTGDLSFQVNRPVKHPGNPVYAGTDMSYDRHLVYVDGVTIDDRVHLWTGAWDDNWGEANVGIALTYAYSDDGGLSFVKPNLGLVSYGGNTNNNILIGGGPVNVAPNVAVSCSGMTYEPSNTAAPFLFHVTYVTTNQAQLLHRIYGALEPDGPLFLVQEVGPWSGSVPRVGGGSNVMRDVWGLQRRPDGKWLMVYQETSAVERRSVGVMLSDQTTLDENTTWSNYGVPTGLLAEQPYDQYYAGTPWQEGNSLLMITCMFSGGSSGSLSDYYYVYPYGTFVGTNDRQWKFELWRSHIEDGLTWTKLDEDWMWAGSGIGDMTPGEWDAGAIKPGAMLRVGDKFRLYYSGSSEVHHPLAGRDDFVDQHRIGFAELDWGGVGGLTGTGEATPQDGEEFVFAEAGALTITSVGDVLVELLDENDDVIPGYARTDCVPITGDVMDHPVVWDDHTVTPAWCKARLILVDATVHFLTPSEAEAEPPPETPDVGLTLDESSIFTQSGTAITARALTGRRSSVGAVAYSETGGAIWVTGDDVAAFDIDGDPVDGQTAIVLTAGVPLNLELGVTPVNAGPLAIQIGIPE